MKGGAGLISPGESCGGAAQRQDCAAKSNLINGSLFRSSACAWTVIENRLAGKPIGVGSPLIEGFVIEMAAMVHADYIEIQDSPTFCC